MLDEQAADDRPAAVESIDAPAQIPTAIWSFSGGKVTRRIESVPGIIIAPPIPWTTRIATSRPIECESPQPSDASAKAGVKGGSGAALLMGG